MWVEAECALHWKSSGNANLAYPKSFLHSTWLDFQDLTGKILKAAFYSTAKNSGWIFLMQVSFKEWIWVVIIQSSWYKNVRANGNKDQNKKTTRTSFYLPQQFLDRRALEEVQWCHLHSFVLVNFRKGVFHSPRNYSQTRGVSVCVCVFVCYGRTQVSTKPAKLEYKFLK